MRPSRPATPAATATRPAGWLAGGERAPYIGPEVAPHALRESGGHFCRVFSCLSPGQMESHGLPPPVAGEAPAPKRALCLTLARHKTSTPVEAPVGSRPSPLPIFARRSNQPETFSHLEQVRRLGVIVSHRPSMSVSMNVSVSCCRRSGSIDDRRTSPLLVHYFATLSPKPRVVSLRHPLPGTTMPVVKKFVDGARARQGRALYDTVVAEVPHMLRTEEVGRHGPTLTRIGSFPNIILFRNSCSGGASRAI